jgi:phosphatidylinositol alpha-mannosyltransferase
MQLVPFLSPKRSALIGTFHSVFPKSGKLRFASMFMRPSIERLHGRIVVSKACIESLDPYFPSEYTVIPNGIDDQHFSPAAEPFPEFADGRHNILYVGRFDPRNGLDTMLRAFTLVRRARGDTVRLIVVGDGPLRALYQRAVPQDVADSIVWAGTVNRDRPRYFASADLLCTPCERASFGMVLLEAMSCGLPVVASRNSGFQLVMEHQKHGLMVDNSSDAPGFARGIEQLLDRPEDMERMGRAGRQTAIERFSWSTVGARLEEYYSEVVAARKAAV